MAEITNLYPHLPGHLVQFKDGGLQLTTADDIDPSAVGASLLILGTAFDGPVMEPVKIDSTTVSQLYGKDVDGKGFPNGATLTKYAKQAFRNGFVDVRCIRVTGSESEVELLKNVEDIYHNVDVPSYIGDTSIAGTIGTANGRQGRVVKGIDRNLMLLVNSFDIPANDSDVASNQAGVYNAAGFNKSLKYYVENENELEDNESQTFISSLNDSTKTAEFDKGNYGDDVSATTEGMSYKIQLTGSTEGRTYVLKYDKVELSNFDNTYNASGTFSGTNGLSIAPDSTINELSNKLFLGAYIDVEHQTIIAGDNPAQEGWYESNGTGYELVSETSVIENKTYYKETYTSVTPDGSENPQTQGWFEKNGDNYDLSTDSTVDNLKTYYELTYTSVSATPDTPGTPVHTRYATNDTNPVFTLNKNTGAISIAAAQDGFSDGDSVTACFLFTYKGDEITETFTTTVNGIVLNVDTGKNAIAIDADIDVVTDSIEVYVWNNGMQRTLVDSSKYTYNNATRTVTLKSGYFEVGDVWELAFTKKITEHITEGVTIQSIYGGALYNEAKVIVSADANNNSVFEFVKPEKKKYSNGEGSIVLSAKDYPTIGRLRSALESHALNNVFRLVSDDDEMSSNGFIAGTYQLSGGEDGVNPNVNDMYKALSGTRFTSKDIGTVYDGFTITANEIGYLKKQGAYQVLENYNVDYVYVAGVYADTEVTPDPDNDNFLPTDLNHLFDGINGYPEYMVKPFQYQLAIFCMATTYRTRMTHGFIDVKPNVNTTLIGIQKYVNKLLTYGNTHYMMDNNGTPYTTDEGEYIDIGWYTSCVVGPEPVMTSDTLGQFYASPAIAYAALNSSLKPQSAPTNKALPNVRSMKFKLSNKQMEDLTANRMIVFKYKNEGMSNANNVPYVVDGCTSGQDACDYKRFTTVKVVTDVVDQIREVSDPFIGEPNTIEQRNALSALISKRLSYLLEEGEITYYEFEIVATLNQVILGECSIMLTLGVPQELRKITTVVGLRAVA